MLAAADPLCTGVEVKNFWVPDIYFVEAKDVALPSKINPPRALQFHNHGKHTGCSMILRAKETITVGCSFNFHMYPIDVNTCYLNIRSFAYPARLLVLRWNSVKRLRVNPKMQTLVCTIQTTSQDRFSEWRQDVDNDGQFTGVRVIFRFSRNISNQLITTYIPSIILVITSFSCFWISVDAGEQRITLTTTTVLALYTQITMVRLSIPPTSYITNIDIWLLATLGFNLSSTFECALIHGMHGREQKRQRAIAEVELSRGDGGQPQQIDALSIAKKTSSNYNTNAHLPFERKMSRNMTNFQTDRSHDYTRVESRRSREKTKKCSPQRSSRRHNKYYATKAEYYDFIGRNIIVGTFVVFCIGYSVHMIMCLVTDR